MNKKISFSILLTLVMILSLAALEVLAVADGGGPLGKTANKIKGAFVVIGGAVVVIGWVVAGILYLTAAGSPEKLGTAKKALVAAIVGTILIAIATGTQGAIKFIEQYFQQ